MRMTVKQAMERLAPVCQMNQGTGEGVLVSLSATDRLLCHGNLIHVLQREAVGVGLDAGDEMQALKSSGITREEAVALGQKARGNEVLRHGGVVLRGGNGHGGRPL